jgi:hypothetical protein
MMFSQTLVGPHCLRAILLLIASLGVQAASAGATLDFDQVFSAAGEPRQLHYRASYLLNGTEHEVEVWRDRDQHLKRRTDNAFEIHVYKPAGDVEWHMVTLDLRRHIRTDIARTNLYRIGHITDWFSLAHSLTRPVGAYSLQALAAPPDHSEKPLAACRWYALTRAGVQSRICWSIARRLPLLITDQSGKTEWKITAVDARPPAADVYMVRDQGFVRNNADEDIKVD